MKDLFLYGSDMFLLIDVVYSWGGSISYSMLFLFSFATVFFHGL